MPTRFSRRLAGCIVIELLLPLALIAADPEFRAGTSESGAARVLVLQDRRGRQAILVQANFRFTQPLSDRIAAELLKLYDFDRASLVLRGASGRPADTQAVMDAVAAAMLKLDPAIVRFNGNRLSVVEPQGQCRASVSLKGDLAAGNCSGGETVRGAIRAAFRVFEPPHGLERRDHTSDTYPIQAIAIGNTVTILALGGDVSWPLPGSKTTILANDCNDTKSLPGTPAAERAVRETLARVGR